MTEQELVEKMAIAISGAPRPTKRSLNKVRAALSVIREAGGAVVPADPNEAMLEAGRKAWKAKRLHLSHAASDEFMTCGVIYRAMIAAIRDRGEKE